MRRRSSWARSPPRCKLARPSGVSRTESSLDGGAWLSGTSGTLRLAVRHRRVGYARGAHLVEYRSTDNADNVETIKSGMVTLGS